MSVWGRPVLMLAKGAASGAVAEITDAAPAPLQKLSVSVSLNQLGSGTPTTTNIRPIVGWGEVKAWDEATYDQSATPHVLTFPVGSDRMASGTVDLPSGVISIRRVFIEFDGSEDWWMSTFSGGAAYSMYRVAYYNRLVTTLSNTQFGCSHYASNASGVVSSSTSIGCRIYSSSSTSHNGESCTYIQIRPNLTAIPTLADWKQFLADQKAAGTPVQVYFLIPTSLPAVIVNATPQQIVALNGANSIWSDAGDVNVEYIKKSMAYVS